MSRGDEIRVSNPIQVSGLIDSPWLHIELDEGDGMFNIEAATDGEVHFLIGQDTGDGEVSLFSRADPEKCRSIADSLYEAAEYAETQ